MSSRLRKRKTIKERDICSCAQASDLVIIAAKYCNMNSDHESAHDNFPAGGGPPALQRHGAEGKDFKDWFQQYMATDANRLTKDSPLIHEVNSDEIDMELVEKRIQESTPQAPTTNGFCDKCLDLFANWPTLGGSSTREHDSRPDPAGGGWECAVARTCNTFELEGLTRLGCRFCTFLLQSLKDSELLDTFRKVELRLYHLDETALLSSLSLQNWGTNPIQILWLNLPGKVCSWCNNGVALHTKVESRFLPASGKIIRYCRLMVQPC